MTAPLRIGTRGSALALWQAQTVAGGLQARGRHGITRTGRDPLTHPAALGRRLAEALVSAGALEILDEVRQ